METVNLCAVGYLFEYPTYIVHDQRVVGQIHVRGERVSPPSKAQDHQKHAIGPPTIEVVEREVVRGCVVGRGPLLPRGWLDGEPPREDGCAELPGVHVVTAGVFSCPLKELGYLGGPVPGWESLTNGLDDVNIRYIEKIEHITKFGYPSLAS